MKYKEEKIIKCIKAKKTCFECGHELNEYEYKIKLSPKSVKKIIAKELKVINKLPTGTICLHPEAYIHESMIVDINDIEF